VSGTNQMRVDISGCEDIWGNIEPTNRCSNNWVFGAGQFFDVSPGFLRSWHGRAQTNWGFDDPYKHTGQGRRKVAGTGVFHFGTRVFFD
jgi:hypothetical protein